jgi:hypothetical protein
MADDTIPLLARQIAFLEAPIGYCPGWDDGVPGLVHAAPLEIIDSVMTRREKLPNGLSALTPGGRFCAAAMASTRL